jgi:GxxExxY protein
VERGLKIQRQVPLPVVFKGKRLDCGYRIDMIVNDSVLLELKAIEKVLPVHEAQLLSYLKLSGKKVGLLLNFHVAYLKDGITRRIL